MSKVTGTPQVEANGEVLPAANGGKTPLEHGRDAGLVRDTSVAKFNGKASVVRSAEYRIAELLHGWAQHDRYSDKPILLSRADFDAAIEAAKAPAVDGTHKPHRAALAPHKGNS